MFFKDKNNNFSLLSTKQAYTSFVDATLGEDGGQRAQAFGRGNAHTDTRPKTTKGSWPPAARGGFFHREWAKKISPRVLLKLFESAHRPEA